MTHHSPSTTPWRQAAWGLALGLLWATANAKTHAWESVYTTLRHPQCKAIQTPDSDPDLPPSIRHRCTGPNGFPYLWLDADSRYYLSFGPQADQERAAEQSPLPFNHIADNAKIEWIFKRGSTARSAPVAAIVRYHIASQEATRDHQALVAFQIAPGRTCLMAFVDARANRDANILIRQAVYQQAGAFDCARQPRPVGKVSALMFEP